jgi:hypothetical protein
MTFPGGAWSRVTGSNAQPNSACRSSLGSGSPGSLVIRATVTVTRASASERRETGARFSHLASAWARACSYQVTASPPLVRPRAGPQARAAREGENGLQTTAVRRPGTARTGGNGAPGTSQVHDRYNKDPRQVHRTTRNRREPLPLWHLIPGRK